MTSKDMLAPKQFLELKTIRDLYREAVYFQSELLDIVTHLIADLEREEGELPQNIIGELIRYKNIIQNEKFLSDLKLWLQELYKTLVDILPKDISVSIKCRKKSFQSTLRKVLINYLEGTSINLFDIVAFRIILKSETIDEKELEKFCYLVKDICISFFTNKRCVLCTPAKIVGSNTLVKDYILNPKKNGYKSIHLALKTLDNNVFEIQIRTDTMHIHAEFGDSSWTSYKEFRLSTIIGFISFDKDRLEKPYPLGLDKEVYVLEMP